MEPVATPAYDARLLTTDAWSGGEVLIASAAFAVGNRDLPTVLVDGSTVAVRRVDDTTVAARLPEIVAGAYSVRIESRPLSATLDDVTVHGFIDVRDGPLTSNYILPWPGGGAPTYLANGERQLLFVDLRLNTVTVFPDSVHDPTCVEGPGQGYRPDRILLRARGATGCGPLRAWSLSPNLELAPEDTTVMWTTRLGGEVNPTVLLLSEHHTISTYAGGSLAFRDYYESTTGVRVSPRRDRATVRVISTTKGLPVFDGQTGLPSYHLTELASGGGAEFTPDGDTLFAAGVDSTRQGSLFLAVDAVAGTRLRAVPFAFTPDDLALDPEGRWIYILGVRSPFTMVVMVVDRATLAPVATLAVVGGTCTCYEFRLVLSPPERKLYVVAQVNGSWTSQVYRFDVAMPPTQPTPLNPE